MIQFLKRRRHLSKIGQLGIVLFIVALAMSFIDTIWAIYLFKYFNNESLVGLVSSFFTIISFLSYLLIIPVIEKYDNKKLYLIGILGMALAYFAFAFTENIWIIILVGCLLSIFTVLRIDTYGILIKDNSKKAELSANEGLIYTIMNVAWTIGPIIAGFISGKFGIPIIFTLAGIFNIIAIGFFILIKIFYWLK